MDYEKQFGIVLGNSQKPFLGITEVLEIFLGNTGTQVPLGGLREKDDAVI